MNILEYEKYQEKISHGNPLFPYITYLCSIPLDFSYVPIHWHDEMEIIYIKTVSYTHLDVYKRQVHPCILLVEQRDHRLVFHIQICQCLIYD